MGKQAFDDGVAVRKQHFFLLPHPPHVWIIGLDTDDGPEHPLYDPDYDKKIGDLRNVDEMFVKNIMKFGVLEPGLCVKDGDRTLVADARYRTLAARKANEIIGKNLGFDPYKVDPQSEIAKKLIRVPFILKMAGDDQSKMELVVAANARPDRNIMGRAMKAQRMLDRGVAPKDVAIDMGVSVNAIHGWSKLLGLGDRMKEAVIMGRMTASAAVEFADLSVEEQTKILDEADAKGIVINTPEARRQRVARSNGKSNGDSRGKPIGVSVLRKLFEHETFMAEAPPEVRQFLGWAIGEKSVPRIKGMTAALKELGVISAEE